MSSPSHPLTNYRGKLPPSGTVKRKMSLLVYALSDFKIMFKEFCMCVLVHVCVFVIECTSHVCKHPGKVLDSLELELQAIVNCLI